MADGDVWISGDTIGVTRMNTKTNVVGTVPSSPIAGQVWLDTANNLLKIRNAANNAWLTVGPSTNYISSVDSGIFTVTAGQLLFNYTIQNVGTVASPSFAAVTTTLAGGLAVSPYGMQLLNEQIQFGNGSNAYENVLVSRTALNTLTLQGDANIYFKTGASGVKVTQIDSFGNLIVAGTVTGTQYGTSGDNGQFTIVDRSNSANSFIIYSISNIFRWYSGGVDIATIDSTGIFSANGYVNLSPSAVSANPWLGTVTTSRATNTVYQNLTGKSIVVTVSVILAGNAAATQNYINCFIGSTSTPATPVGAFTNTTIDQYVSVVMFVPNNWYYKVTPNGSVTLNSWAEQYL